MKLLAIVLLALCQESPFYLPQTDTTPRLVQGSGQYEQTRQPMTGLKVENIRSKRAICRLRDYPYKPFPHGADAQ